MEKLPAEDEWVRLVTELEECTVPATKEELKDAIISAIKKMIPQQRFGILFSGGVDSSLIALVCRQSGADFCCYCVGIKGSPDIISARKAAELLGVRLKAKEFSIAEAEQLFKEVAAIVPSTNVLSVGVGTVLYAAASLAKEDGISFLFSGLGSEEIFAGYHYHTEAEDINKECWKGLKELVWKRDLARDSSIANKLGITVLTPFLDTEVIKKAMGIPAGKKVSEGHKKVILREIAEEIRLPKEIAWRKKMAAQYGSRFDHVIELLAKKKRVGKTAYLQSFGV